MRLVITAVLALSAAAVMAGPPNPAQCHSSETIQIRGVTGQFLYGHFTLKKLKGESRTVQWEAFPDVTSGSQRSIEAGMVAIAPQSTVANDTLVTFAITIQAVSDPGDYCGPLRVFDATSVNPVIYPLLVRVDPLVTHTPIVPNAAAGPHLVKCSGKIDCFLAKFLLRRDLSNSFNALGTVQSRNAGAFVNPIPTDMYATGITTFKTVGLGTVVPGRVQYKQETGLWTIPGTARLEQIEPDQYSGTLYVTMPRTAEPIAVPVTFAVRSGPLWVLVLLLAGFFIAWLIQWIDTKGQPQIDLLRRAERIPRALSPADAALLAEQVEEFQKNAYRFDLGAAEEQMIEIEARVRVLQHLRRLEVRLRGMVGAGPTLAKIERARDEIRQGFDDQAKALVDEIEKALSAPPQPAMTGQLDEAVRTALKGRTSRLKSRAQMLPGAPFKGWLARRREDVRDWFLEARTNTFRFLIRPLLFTVVVILLLSICLDTFWISKPAFGSSVADYVSVFTWGMGANVATKTVGSLHGMITR